jgi:hypothetical protein
MTIKAREYRTRADQCDRRAGKTRDSENREWQALLARVYRALAEAENEVAARRLAAKRRRSARPTAFLLAVGGHGNNAREMGL